VLQNSIVFAWANTNLTNNTSNNKNTNAEHEPTSVANSKVKHQTIALAPEIPNDDNNKADEVRILKPKLNLKANKKKTDKTRVNTSHNIKSNIARVS
jgi:hypothetical protein